MAHRLGIPFPVRDLDDHGITEPNALQEWSLTVHVDGTDGLSGVAENILERTTRGSSRVFLLTLSASDVESGFRPTRHVELIEMTHALVK